MSAGRSLSMGVAVSSASSGSRIWRSRLRSSSSADQLDSLDGRQRRHPPSRLLGEQQSGRAGLHRDGPSGCAIPRRALPETAAAVPPSGPAGALRRPGSAVPAAVAAGTRGRPGPCRRPARPRSPRRAGPHPDHGADAGGWRPGARPRWPPPPRQRPSATTADGSGRHAVKTAIARLGPALLTNGVNATSARAAATYTAASTEHHGDRPLAADDQHRRCGHRAEGSLGCPAGQRESAPSSTGTVKAAKQPAAIALGQPDPARAGWRAARPSAAGRGGQATAARAWRLGPSSTTIRPP